MKRLIACCLSLFFAMTTFTQVKHSFTLGKQDFLLDNKPFQIISGELHPARIPKEYWRHRIQMIKAMGCNTIASYIFWNYHEQSPGVFDFKTDNHNIREFLKICQEENMWVLIRPGPYVCGEWDLGGLPSYLLKIPDIKIRCRDPRYMKAVRTYVYHLSIEIEPYIITNGGPVIMLQVENEYGSYANDKGYMEELSAMWRQNGINIPAFTADGPTRFMLEAGSVDGAAIGLDSGSSEADFEQAKKRNPGVPSFSSETYPGWLTHWGEKFARPDTNNLKREIEFLLKTKRSFNLYVAHGGTNFGFTAGANAFSPTQYQPDITSYDYDAPIDEQGRPTAKFFMLRRLISQYVSYTIPDVPQPIPVIEIPSFNMEASNSIWYNLPAPIYSVQPKPMEAFDQDHGLILYETELVGHRGGKLTITEPHDYALVFLNGQFIDTVYRDGGKWTIDLPESKSDAAPTLEILVEAMGRINFAQYMIDRKGITDRVTLNGMTLMNWKIYPLPMEASFVKKAAPFSKGNRVKEKATFLMGEFNLEVTGDTYLDMSNYSKGILYVNGHNLGRYWNIGPQQRLYCPASWLNKGKNEVIVFDLHQNVGKPISGRKTME